MTEHLQIRDGRCYRHQPGSMLVTPTNRRDGSFLPLAYDVGTLVPVPEVPLPYQEKGGFVHKVGYETLLWLVEMMTPDDGSYPSVAGLHFGTERLSTCLRGEIVRTVRVSEPAKMVAYRPTLTPNHVADFLALPGIQGTIHVEVNPQSGWAALHCPTAGISLYRPLRLSLIVFPDYEKLIATKHAYREVWTQALTRKYSAKKSVTLRLERNLMLNGDFLRGVPDGVLCYSDPRKHHFVWFHGTDGRGVLISLEVNQNDK